MSERVISLEIPPPSKANPPSDGMSLLYPVTKKVTDVLAAAVGLTMASPLLLTVAMLVKATSPGSVFYRGIRTGKDGVPFRIMKFRTMVTNAESLGGPSTALNDPRLTRIGKFLRKYKLDELPQLINVLVGDMSLVGPRPQVQKYTDLYNDEEKLILSVRPGLTDYASLRFINLDQMLGDGNVDEKYLKEIEPAKNRLRIEYVKKHCLAEDLRILFMTVLQMFKIRSKWNTGS
jgi:lipopolysaccharide/colanic/teichoic acid biosynthesis glycosyltransferase